jgi:hypothetical protein
VPASRTHGRPAAPALLCACLLVLILASNAAPAAVAKPAAAGIRVVDAGNRSLAQGTQLTEPLSVRTSPRADCFGPGTGGSGERARVPASSALAQLASAAAIDDDLSPLGITDFFDFGLGICRIGGAVAPMSGYWYLKVNHEASFSGAEQTTVHRGDEVLWHLIEDFNDPIPDELELRAPSRARPGAPFGVHVTAYADDGDASPAVGARVTGADTPTDVHGRTTVTVEGRSANLRATRAGAIASDTEAVCTTRLRDCPAGYETTIGGTTRRDEITGGKAAERILAGAGRDRVDARAGRAPDRINCGPGRDRLLVKRGSASRWRSCERVRFRR